MKLFEQPDQMQAYCLEAKKAGRSIGFVPTMGALHKGHLELVRRSVAENDITVLSIFINPTQFNNTEDFEKYPRLVEQDLKLLSEEKVDAVFTPGAEALYPDKFNYSVNEKNRTQVLCGASRPGHFTGVLTIVMKLLNITQPHRLYLGEKDYQQLALIRDMVDAFFIPIDVRGVPTVRDEQGLALSSRNQRLSPTGVETARRFAQVLRQHKPLPEIREDIEKLGIQIDYLDEIWGRRFAAVHVENVRLIDNVET